MKLRLLFAIVGSPLICAAAVAGSDEFMVKSPTVRFRSAPGSSAVRNTDDDPAARILEATTVTPLWVNTRLGWLRRDELVPLGEAIEYFSKAINAKPTAFGYARRAKALLRGGRHREAAQDAKIAIGLDPASPCAAYCMGASLMQEGDEYAAMLAFARSARLAQPPRPTYGPPGVQDRGERDDADAHTVFDVLQIEGNCASACAARGLALMFSGEDGNKSDPTKRAVLRELAESLRRDPSSGVARAYARELVWRARTWGWRDDRTRTLADIAEAIRVQPDYAEAYFARGELLCRPERPGGAPPDYEAAVRDLERAARLDSHNIYFRVILAITLSIKGDYEKSLACADQAVELSSGRDASAYYARAMARGNLGHLKEAIADYSKSIQLDATNRFVYLERGHARLKLGLRDAALSDFQSAVELGPEWVMCRLGRAQGLLSLGRTDEAFADCAFAIKSNPRLAEAYDLRGQVMAARSTLQEAVADFSRAIELDPSTPDVYLRRARALRRMGKLLEATADLDHIGDVAELVDAVRQERVYVSQATKHGATK